MLRRPLTRALTRASVGPLAHEPPLRLLPLRVEADLPWSGASRSACAASWLVAAPCADDCACDAACGWRGAASQALLRPQPLLPATGAPRRSGAAVDRGWAAQQLPQTASFATAPRAGVTAPAAVAGMQRGGVRVVMVSPNVSGRESASRQQQLVADARRSPSWSLRRLWRSRTRDGSHGCRSARCSREPAGANLATECVSARAARAAVLLTSARRALQLIGRLKSVYAMAKVKKDVPNWTLATFKAEAIQLYTEVCTAIAANDHASLRHKATETLLSAIKRCDCGAAFFVGLNLTVWRRAGR